ncbi:hypothetical protein BDN70DRAFT_821350, partial [Pholiota conissans]
TAVGRQARLFVDLLSLDNKIEAFRSSVLSFHLSDELKTTIDKYAIAVLLSVKLNTFRGNTPRNHILNILKWSRDLPQGIENDSSNWEKIRESVSHALTQAREKVKKLIREGIEQNMNIYGLAQIIIDGTACRPTIPLCTRTNGGGNYWDAVDDRLISVHNSAGNDANKILMFILVPSSKHMCLHIDVYTVFSRKSSRLTEKLTA